MTKVTKKEMAFLSIVADSDFSYDAVPNFGDYIDESSGYDMKVVRGLIPSLVEKGIIDYDDDVDGDGSGVAWACIDAKFIDVKNHKLIGLEVV